MRWMSRPTSATPFRPAPTFFPTSFPLISTPTVRPNDPVESAPRRGPRPGLAASVPGSFSAFRSTRSLSAGLEILKPEWYPNPPKISSPGLAVQPSRRVRM
jgi:hypothetical protein